MRPLVPLLEPSFRVPITRKQIGDRSDAEAVKFAKNGKRETVIFSANEGKGDASENEKKREAGIGDYLFHNVSSLFG